MLANCFEVTLCCSRFPSYSVEIIDEKTSGTTIDNNICTQQQLKRLFLLICFQAKVH